MEFRLVASLLLILCCRNILARDIFVSTHGNDQWDGTTDISHQRLTHGPYLTLQKAQLSIREEKKISKLNEPIIVHIEPGTYFIREPLQFDIRDSGFPEKPIRWQGDNGKVIISGGIELHNCQNTYKERWQCPVADLALGKIPYNSNSRKQGYAPGFELFANNQRMTLARWPNSGWAHIRLPLDKSLSFTTIEPLPMIGENDNDSQVHIFAGNDWFDQYLPVGTVDSKTSKVTLAKPTGYPLEKGRRFYLLNVESQLDAPGEWHFNNKNGTIDFIQPGKQKPSDVTVSTSKHLIIFRGTSNLEFNNIQLNYSTDTAVTIEQSKNISLTNLDISNVGGNGVIANGSNHITIKDCNIHHTGEGGILLNGGNRDTLESSEYFAHNNYIHEFGKTLLTYSPAIDLSGVGAKVTNNLISYGGGEAIEIKGNNHLIEKNEIHHACEEASDCGAIYTGRDWSYRGNVIRHNYIHDIYGYGLNNIDIENHKVTYASPNGARGIYLDDAASGFVVYGNILNKAGQMAIQIGGGRDNTIENNVIFTYESYGLWIDNRWPEFDWQAINKNLSLVPYKGKSWAKNYPELSLPMKAPKWPEGNKIQNNVIISDNTHTSSLFYQLPAENNIFSSNLVWNKRGAFLVDFQLLDKGIQGSKAPWLTWLASGIETHSNNLDPCVTLSGKTVRFCNQDPKAGISFKPIPNTIGLIEATHVKPPK